MISKVLKKNLIQDHTNYPAFMNVCRIGMKLWSVVSVMSGMCSVYPRGYPRERSTCVWRYSLHHSLQAEIFVL